MMVPLQMKEDVRRCVFEEDNDSLENVRCLAMFHFMAISISTIGSSLASQAPQFSVFMQPGKYDRVFGVFMQALGVDKK